MKRITALFLTALLVLHLSSCGGTSVQEAKKSAPAQNVTAASTEQARETNTNSAKKILVAYFTVAENSDVDAVSSASVVTVVGFAKGRVQALAEMIRSETGGDLFSIQTSTEYPGDIGKLIDFAAVEQDANARPELTTHIENLDDYDVVFVGYPNWWYDMPMVMYSFFEEYDFSGKTIIPFNVHNGSRFSSTISTIQELEPQAEVITDGFTVSERNVADAAKDVADWLDNLGY
ncbi:MAG: flavodoxin [Candidatus Ornithospirochaeta sp.]